MFEIYLSLTDNYFLVSHKRHYYSFWCNQSFSDPTPYGWLNMGLTIPSRIGYKLLGTVAIVSEIMPYLQENYPELLI